MTNITPNTMAQTNMSILADNYKSFEPVASALFAYSGDATKETDDQIKNARTLLQNMIDILPQIMQAINDTPVSGA
jgi:hypothetical protein